MKIIGIDPGTARLGWAIITWNQGKLSQYSYGCILTDKSEPEEKRLGTLHDEIKKVITHYQPAVASIEQIFFATNAKTVIPVAEARGIALFTCAESCIPVVSYSPLAVKLAITGDGKADKAQVQYMLTKLLKLTRVPEPDDAADALAIALTHAYSSTMRAKTL